MSKQQPKRSPRSRGGSRFYRGAQMVDKSKIAQVDKRKSLRSKTEARQAKQRLRRILARISSLILAILLIIGLFSRMFITSVTIDNKYRNATEDYLRQNRWQYLKPFFDNEQLSQQLLQAHPELLSVDISTELLSNSLKVKTTPRQPELLWRIGDTDQYYLVDSQGIAYEKIPVASLAEPMIEFRDDSGVNIDLSNAVIAPGAVTDIQQIQSFFKGVKYDLDYISYGTVPQDLHLYIKNQPYFIKTTTTRSISDQLATYGVILKEKGSIAPKQYIDIRVADKVFYK